METRAPYAAVGLFLVVFMVVTIAIALWKTASEEYEATAEYHIEFAGSVYGLADSSTVYYQGLSVGTVRKIELAAQAGKVDVEIEISSAVPVTTKTEAVLESNLVTGVAYIQLLTKLGPQEARPLTTRPGYDYPVIPSKSTGIDALFANIPQVLNAALRVLNGIDAVLNEQNRANVASILQKVDNVFGNIDRGTKDLDMFVSEARALITQANTTLEKTNKLLETGEGVIDEDVRALIQDSQNAINNVSQLVSRLDGIVAANEDNVNEFLDVTLSDTSRMISDLRITTRALSRILIKLEDNPAGYLFSKGGRKYEPEEKTGNK